MKGFSLPSISLPNISIPSKITDASQVKSIIESVVPSDLKDLVGNLDLEGEASKILSEGGGLEIPNEIKDFLS